MLKLRHLLLILILIAVLAVTIAVWRHLQQLRPEEILAALPKQVDLSLEELHYTQNEEGERSWTLDSDRAEYQRDTGQALLEGVRLTLYHAGRFGEVKLRADQGKLEQDNRQVEVWGQVVVSTGSGEQLFTERLHFDGQRQQLFTAEPIRAVTPQMELTGTGMRVDLNNGRLLVEKDVRVLLAPAERKVKADE